MTDLAKTHKLHRDDDGMWMYQSNGVWTAFMNDSHFVNTRDLCSREQYPIAYFKLVVHLPANSL